MKHAWVDSKKLSGFQADFVWHLLALSYNLSHTPYSKNNMGQKCESNCGLWVLNEMIKKIHPENLKQIVDAVWELPAK